MAKVSVIIPVYKVEKYIERCATSLFSQTLDDIEFIFVDDCGGDKSFDILHSTLEKFPHRKSQVKILKNAHNMGVGQSRQRGVDFATGDYIIHCDPDDWVDVDMYELMYDRAIETGAGIVICGFVNEFSDRSVTELQTVQESKEKLLYDLVEGELHCALWNKLVKGNLAKKYRIEKGVNLWEDKSIVIPMMCDAEKIESIDKCLYHYRIASDISIVHNFSKENVRSKIAAIEVMRKHMQNAGHSKFLHSHVMRLQELKAKRGLLSLSPPEISQWRTTFPESNSHYNDKAHINLGYRVYATLLKYRLDFMVHVISKLVYLKNK